TLQAEANGWIEEYVDPPANTAQLSDQSTSFVDHPPLYESLASWGWRGVQTAEDAKVMLVEEVARRSVGKGDLALLLSSIDHVALQMCRTIPEELISRRENGTLSLNDV